MYSMAQPTRPNARQQKIQDHTVVRRFINNYKEYLLNITSSNANFHCSLGKPALYLL